MRTKLLSTVASVRHREAIIFQAPAVLGLAVFIPAITAGSIAAVVTCIGSFLSAALHPRLQRLGRYQPGFQNSLKRHGTFVERGVHPTQMLGLALALAAAGLLVFSFLSGPHVAAAFVAIVLGLAYSVPIGGLRGKSIPLFSSFLHFGGTLLSFLLGALTFAPADWRGLLIAAHPAILLTAGHLVQEVEDFEEDRLSGCRTNPVRFGRTPVFFVAAVLFGLSFLLLYGLTDAGFFPPFVRYTVALYPVYLALALECLSCGATRAGVRRLRDRYRCPVRGGPHRHAAWQPASKRAARMNGRMRRRHLGNRAAFPAARIAPSSGRTIKSRSRACHRHVSSVRPRLPSFPVLPRAFRPASPAVGLARLGDDVQRRMGQPGRDADRTAEFQPPT